MSESSAVILAAGKSTRMQSEVPKVLHEICGRPMLAYVLDACRLSGIDRLVVVVGYGKERVKERFSGEKGITWVEQTEQKGTGHAVSCCQKALKGFDGGVVVMAGDMPLVRRETLASLVELRSQHGDALAMATSTLDDPAGYGRVVRDEQGELAAIVEDKDCTEAQRQIREVNPSFYCFDAKRLFDALERVVKSPASGEYYLTDTVALLRESGHGVSARVSVTMEESVGINSRLDLAKVSRMMQDRIQLLHMTDGVTVVDPDNTWIEAEASIGQDTTIYPFSMIKSGAMIGTSCRIGPFAFVAAGASVDDGQCVGSFERQGVSKA